MLTLLAASLQPCAPLAALRAPDHRGSLLLLPLPLLLSARQKRGCIHAHACQPCAALARETHDGNFGGASWTKLQPKL